MAVDSSLDLTTLLALIVCVSLVIFRGMYKVLYPPVAGGNKIKEFDSGEDSQKQDVP